ncbi:MAG: hypothetical protein AAF824_11040 [Bacteroidota bacterium]
MSMQELHNQLEVFAIDFFRLRHLGKLDDLDLEKRGQALAILKALLKEVSFEHEKKSGRLK